MFRGEVLVDAGDAEWVQPQRVRLEEIRLGLLEDSLAARAASEPGGEVIGELESLVDQHPLREGLWTALITALYRAGRQADALGGLRGGCAASWPRSVVSSRVPTCGPSSSRCCSTTRPWRRGPLMNACRQRRRSVATSRR